MFPYKSHSFPLNPRTFSYLHLAFWLKTSRIVPAPGLGSLEGKAHPTHQLPVGRPGGARAQWELVGQDGTSGVIAGSPGWGVIAG